MALLQILQYPNPRLHIKAKPVVDINQDYLQQIIDDMLETLSATSGCAGLAATQLDIINPPRVTVINSTEVTGHTLCLINPEILTAVGEENELEGCMSIYPDDIRGYVKRAAKITVKALDRYGKINEFSAEGFLAKCIQHEIDHLNGILYITHLAPLKRKLVEKKIAKIRRMQGKVI